MSAATLAAGPAAQAPAKAQEGAVILQVEEWFVTPRNVDLDYAFIDTSGSLSGGGDIVTIAPSGKTVPRLRTAWRLPGESEASFGGSFWEIDAKGTSETGRHPSMVGALLASPDFAIGRSLVDSAEARTRIRATSIDADISWELERGGRAKLGFAAGLRFFRYEENRAITYAAERFGEPLREFINSATDASGIGPRGGLSFGYRIGRRVVAEADLGLALAVGDLEGEATDAAFRDLDGDGTVDFDRATVVHRNGTRKAFSQFDGAVRLEVRIGERITAFTSYQYSEWRQVSVTQRFVDDLSQNSTLPIEGNAVFEGLAVGIRCWF
jgi:hypothetical protein